MFRMTLQLICCNDYPTGETALMKASRESHKDMVKMLLDNGAQADILNYENMTARESTLDVEVDDILSSTKGTDGNVTVEEHLVMNIHSKKDEAHVTPAKDV
jgi:ankyrin repeat protein